MGEINIVNQIPLVRSTYEDKAAQSNLIFFHHYLLLKVSDYDPIKSLFKAHGFDIWVKYLSKEFIVPYGERTKHLELPLERMIFATNAKNWFKMAEYINEVSCIIDGRVNVGFWSCLTFEFLPDNLHIITPYVRVLGLSDSNRTIRPIILEGHRVGFQEVSGISESGITALWLQDKVAQGCFNDAIEDGLNKGSRDDRSHLHGR